MAAGSVVWGIISGFASVLLGMVMLWAFLRGPLSRIAADAMHKISGL
jgi:hypothetical protein